MNFPSTSEIRRLRKSLDVTQAQLAKESGVSQSTIAKIESGSTSASYETVVRIFETLERMRDRARLVTASKIASRDIVTIQSVDTVKSASELMGRTGFSQLPVLKGTMSVGSISEKKIFEAIRSGKSMAQIGSMKVQAIMDDSYPLVSENTPISIITSMMGGFDAVLVTDNGRVTGMITNADLIKLLSGAE